MRFPPLKLLVFLSAFFLSACDESRDSLFPLDDGLRWTYDVTLESQAATTVTQRSVEIAGRKTLDGMEYTIRRWDDGVDYYVAETQKGFFRAGTRTFLKVIERLDTEPRYMLKAPFEAQTAWTESINSHLMYRSGPISPVGEKASLITMHYAIETTDAEVTVPFGKFSNVVLVVGNAIVDSTTSGQRTAVPVTTREWFAPGVGLVKMERHEHAKSADQQGGHFTLELKSFETRL